MRGRLVLVTLALLGGGRARAGAAAAVGDPLADVRRPLADDVVVNWTLERVEVTASAYDPNLATDNKPLSATASNTPSTLARSSRSKACSVSTKRP